MSDTLEHGRRRKRDRTGERIGPHVLSYVGADWSKSRFCRLTCQACVHSITPLVDNLSAVKTKKCGGCGSTGSEVAA